MSRPLVSVIMPAYNAEKYIEESIRSVLAQTYPNWELIIVDDGSMDTTSSIIKGFVKRDERVVYVHQNNGRQARARNNAISHSKGEYLAFLDSDDIWTSDKLELQLKKIEESGVDLIFSDAYIFSKELTKERKMNIQPGIYKEKDGVLKFFKHYYIPMSSVLVKREVVEKVGCFSCENEYKENGRILTAEDHDLWTRILIQGYSILGVEDFFLYARLHENSASSYDRQLIFPQLLSLQYIARTYPNYKEEAGEGFLCRINSHLTQNNIESWEKIEKLLRIRNHLGIPTMKIPYWKFIHIVFGKRVFRIFFKKFIKVYPMTISNRNFENIILKQ